MGRRHLTAKQRTFLEYIREFVRENGIWPTYRELTEYFGFASPNSVTQNLVALEKKGYVRRDHLGFELVRIKDNDAATAFGIPIRGIIAAGALQEAVDADLGNITLETIFPRLDRMFAIKVSGRSMVDAGIDDGDYVLLVDEDIPNGGIGAVLYNGETSLKRIYRQKNGLRLEPANEEYDDIVIQPDVFEEVQVLGRYAGHVDGSGIYRR